MGPAASDCRSGRVADTDGPALCFRMRCVRVSRAVLCPGRSRARLHGSLRPGRGHWPGPPRTDSRPRAPALKFDGPVCRPEPNGPSAGGFVPRHSAFGRLRAGPPPGGRLGPSPAGAHGRLRVARAGSTARGSGPRPTLLVPPAAAVSSPRLTGRQYPGVNPRKAHRPSVPRVSSPWLTSHQRSQFPAAHGQSVPRGSRAVSSRWLTGRQFPRSIPAGPLAGYFRVGAPCEGPAVPRRDPRPGALVRCAASGRRTTRTAADSAGLRPGVRPGCRSRANVTPHYVRSPASSGPDPGPRHRHWGLLALAIESGSGRGEQGGASEVYSQRPAAARARSWHRHRLGFRGPAAWPTAMRHFG